jgi:hypothetical protein
MPFVDESVTTPAPKHGFVDDAPTTAPKGFVDAAPSGQDSQPAQPPGASKLPTPPPPTQFHDDSAIRKTPSPHVHAQNQAQKFFGAATHAVAQGVTGGEQFMAHAWNDTLGGLDAVLGAPGRALQGGIAAFDPSHPDVVKIVRNGIDNAVHPFDTAKVGKNLDTVMRKLGVDYFNEYLDDHVTGKKNHPIVHGVLKFGTNLIVDPLFWAGPVSKLADMANLAGHVQQAASGIAAIVPGSKALAPVLTSIQTLGKDVVKTGGQYFGRRPELDKYLTGDVGKTARMGIENKISNKFIRPAMQKDKELLEQNKAAVKGQGLNVDPLRQRVLEHAFVYGNQQMRAQAMNLGYEQLTRKLHGNDYFLRQDSTAPLGTSKYDVHNAMQDLQTRLTAPGADEFQIWKQHLDNTRTDVAHGLITRETRDFLANHGGIKDFDWANATQAERDRQANQTVQSLSFGPKRVTIGPAGGPIDKLAGFARGAGRNSVMLDPLPHGLRNVGMLAYISGGPVAFGKGLAYAFRGLDAQQLARMSDLGLHADYISSIKGPLGISQVGKIDSNILNRLELGYRQALYEHYDSFLPKALPGHEIARDYQIADHINRDLGDYRNVSAFVSALQALGGPFVAFRVGTVPSAVGRAIRARPFYPESIIKAQDALTDRKHNSEIVIGGPVKDAAEGYFNQADYFASGATAGPVGAALGAEIDAKNPHGTSPVSMGEQFIENTVPGASLGMNAANVVGQEFLHRKDAIFQPYGPTALSGPHSLLHEMLLQVFGLHSQKPRSAKAAARTDRTISRESQ